MKCETPARARARRASRPDPEADRGGADALDVLGDHALAAGQGCQAMGFHGGIGSRRRARPRRAPLGLTAMAGVTIFHNPK